MMIKEYRYKFNINISHSIENGNEHKNIHSHNISIAVFVIDDEKEFILYDDTEEKIRSYLDDYNGKYINRIKPFDVIVPTIENIGAEFFKNLKRILGENSYVMTKLEISEIPTRIYIVKG